MIKYIGNDMFLLEETEPITSLDLFGVYRLHYEFISNVEDNIEIEMSKLEETEDGIIMRVATISIILLLRLKYEIVFNELYLSREQAYLHVYYEDGIEIETKFNAGEEERLVLCLKDKGGFELNNIGLRLNELTELIS
jgi:hypothetical protein